MNAKILPLAPDLLVEAAIRLTGDIPDEHQEYIRATVGVLVGREVIFSHAQVYMDPIEGAYQVNFAFCQARNALDKELAEKDWTAVDRGGPSKLVFTCGLGIKETVDLGEVSSPKQAMQRASLKLAVLHRRARGR